MGGTIAAIEEGWFQREIAESAYATARRRASGELPVIGVNKHVEPPQPSPVEIHRVDAEVEARQVARVKATRARRDPGRVAALLDRLEAEVREIRGPISPKSVSGFVALSKQTVSIADAYDAAELKKISPELSFDSSWDKKTGFRTTQILCMPILHEGKVLGVMQLINKKRGPRFTKDDEVSVARIAKTLGIAFNNQAQMGA